MDYTRAKDTLSRILTDEERFADITKSIFDAIDTDNSGTLEKDEVEDFIKEMLKSMQFDDDGNNQGLIDERYRTVFTVLDENESGEITLDELGKFLRELFKEQIKELQEIIERDKIVQAMIARD
jgi:Ca2+-binding EF-hand superfamily protein